MTVAKKKKARSRSEYYHVSEGEWIRVTKRGYREQCCDCGLVHRLNVRVTESGSIEIQAFRDTRATNGARSQFRFTKED